VRTLAMMQCGGDCRGDSRHERGKGTGEVSKEIGKGDCRVFWKGYRDQWVMDILTFRQVSKWATRSSLNTTRANRCFDIYRRMGEGV